MANFFENLWSKAKGVVKTVVTVAGNIAGPLVGIPGLGTLAGGLLEKIPVKTMAVKAAAAGVVDTQKVAETLTANAVPATDTNIKVVVDAIQKVAIADTTIPVSTTLPVNTVALTGFGKVLFYVQTYWYISFPAIGYGLYYLVKRFIK